MPDRNKKITIKDDSILFPDDAGIAYNDIIDILPKIRIYDKIITKNKLLINWKKVFILAKKMIWRKRRIY